MDSLLAVGSSLPPVQGRSLASRDAESAPFIRISPPAEPNPTAPLDSVQRGDPADDQQRMMHFLSHIDAECFISLLQILDPMPDDSRAQAEYKRHNRQLRDALEVPLPPQNPQPVGLPTD
ncbi:MAG: hypothetical protein ABSA21_03540 [Candidatus Limnocylindrales bacterium]|jgi:hypothetical protein